jgi:hypothetical protein
MNVSGKEKVAKVISDAIRKVITRKEVQPVILKCKDNNGEDQRCTKRNYDHQEDFVNNHLQGKMFLWTV